MTERHGRSSAEVTILADAPKKLSGIPTGQYVDRNNCTLQVRDDKGWEKPGKPLKSLGGCNFRKGNYLRFCRESVSQCGGQFIFRFVVCGSVVVRKKLDKSSRPVFQFISTSES
jgi:hypothetical protein